MKGTKLYDVTGCIAQPKNGRFVPGQKLLVAATKDSKKCTISITCEGLDIQYIIPFKKILKELMED